MSVKVKTKRWNCEIKIVPNKIYSNNFISWTVIKWSMDATVIFISTVQFINLQLIKWMKIWFLYSNAFEEPWLNLACWSNYKRQLAYKVQQAIGFYWQIQSTWRTKDEARPIGAALTILKNFRRRKLPEANSTEYDSFIRLYSSHIAFSTVSPDIATSQYSHTFTLVEFLLSAYNWNL
jgi:hypothetical protein